MAVDRSLKRWITTNMITMTLMPKYYSAIFSDQYGVKEGLDEYVKECNRILADELAGKV